MHRISRVYAIKLLILYFMLVLIGLTILQIKNNALPFIWENYPTYENNGKKYFDSVSEALVLNRIDFSALSMDYGYNFNLWRVNHDVRALIDYRDSHQYIKEFKTTPDYLLNGAPYQSQIGAQSLFYAHISSQLKVDHGDYSSIKLFSVFLLCFFLSIILLWMAHSFGVISSFVGLVFLVLSTGVNLFSQSLYWSLWLFIMPLSIVCLLEILNVKNFFIIFLFLVPAFLFKFLSGYEFITTIVFAAMVPYAWDLLVNKNSVALLRVIAVGASSFMSFSISLIIYEKIFLKDFNLSGIDHILQRSGSWSLSHLGELDINLWMQSAKVLIMNYMDINGYGIPVGVFLILALVVLVVIKSKIKAEDFRFIGFLFVGSASWLIVQPGHILFHPRYATLLIFFPFGLFLPGFLTSLILVRKS